MPAVERHRLDRRHWRCTASLRGQFLRLRDPALDPGRESDLLADRAGCFGPEPCDLPIMEDAEIVELLLDRGRDVMELFEIIGDAARTGENLVARPFSRWRQFIRNRFGRRPGIDAHFALGA